MKHCGFAACHGKLLQGAKSGGRNCPGPRSDLSMVPTTWLSLDQGKAKGISHPTFLPGPSQENALKFSLLGRTGTASRRAQDFFTVPVITPHPSGGSSIPASPQALHDALVPPPHHCLLRANLRCALRHICQTSSYPPLMLHKVKSLPALRLRVMFPLQQCDFLPKIHGRQCFVFI